MLVCKRNLQLTRGRFARRICRTTTFLSTIQVIYYYVHVLNMCFLFPRSFTPAVNRAQLLNDLKHWTMIFRRVIKCLTLVCRPIWWEIPDKVLSYRCSLERLLLLVSPEHLLDPWWMYTFGFCKEAVNKREKKRGEIARFIKLPGNQVNGKTTWPFGKTENANIRGTENLSPDSRAVEKPRLG